MRFTKELQLILKANIHLTRTLRQPRVVSTEAAKSNRRLHEQLLLSICDEDRGLMQVSETETVCQCLGKEGLCCCFLTPMAP